VGRTPGNSLAFIVACCGRADHEVESVGGRNVLCLSSCWLLRRPMRKDHNHRHRLKRGHPFQVLRTTLSLGSTTSLVLERTAIGSCHRRRCLDRGRRNLQRRRRNYRLQRLSRIRRRRLSRMRRNLRPPPLSRIRCPRPPPPQSSQARRRRLS
jgi:hypothetical protein